jgi:hypothetical protein
MSKKRDFSMRSKTGQKQPFWAPFSRPSKTAIFDHFSCVDEFWWFHDVLTTNCDDDKMWTTYDDAVDDEKKLRRGQKNDEKRPSAEPYKKHQNGARYGRWETAERKGHKERLWRDRVRMGLPDVLKKKKKKKTTIT